MKRLQLVLTALMGATMVLCTEPIVTAQDSDRPNIVLIMAEDIGNDLACYGTKGVKTPILPLVSRYFHFSTVVSAGG